MYAGYIDSISIIKLGTSVAAYIVFYHDLQTAVVYILTMKRSANCRSKNCNSVFIGHKVLRETGRQSMMYFIVSDHHCSPYVM